MQLTFSRATLQELSFRSSTMAVSDTESVTGTLDIRSSLSPAPGVSNKRKRDDKSSNTVEKTVKRKKKRKAEAAEDGDLDVDLGLNTAIGKMDSQLFADYVAQRTKRFSGDLSLVELEDRHIPGRATSTLVRFAQNVQVRCAYYEVYDAEKAFVDTSSWNKPRLLSSLPDFLDHYAASSGQIKRLSTASKLKGAPHTIVMTGAGLRAANLTRYR